MGADWEQLRALNLPERSSMDLNGPAPTCWSHVSAGPSDLVTIVRTEAINGDASRPGRSACLTRIHADRGSSAQFRPVPEIHPFVDDPIWC